MLASPDFADRDEARADKTSGSWGEVAARDPAELERELDEHLIDLPNGRVGWRIGVPAMMSYWSELARPIALPPWVRRWYSRSRLQTPVMSRCKRFL